MSGTSPTTTPTLNFQLIGNWRRIILGPDEQIAASVRDYVAELVGSADAEAQVRALMRARFAGAFVTARDAGAVSVFLASEITPGTPMPIGPESGARRFTEA